MNGKEQHSNGAGPNYQQAVLRLSVGTARTLPAVLEEKAKEGGDRSLLLRDGRVIATYASFRARTRQLAPRLRSLLSQEEASDVDLADAGKMKRPIAVLCANGPPLLELCMAAWYLRRPVLLLPTSATLDIIVDLITLAEPLVLIHGGPGLTDDDEDGLPGGTSEEEARMRTALAEQMEKLASSIGQRCPQLKLIAITDDRLNRNEDPAAQAFDYEPQAGEEDEVCCVLSTSASTTGTSVKAVPLTHTNLLYSCVSRNHLWSGHIDDADRVLGWLPMFHIMGLLLDFLNSALYCGGSYAFCPLAADLSHALIRGIQMHRPTLLSTVPWMLAEWRRRIEAAGGGNQSQAIEILEALRSLKALLTGGAPIADDLALFFETRGVKLFQSEGMTECSGSLFTGHPSDTSFRTLRMHPSIAYEWLPVDDGLIEGGDGGGELVIVDSPAVTPGYLKNDAANQKAFFWESPAGHHHQAVANDQQPPVIVAAVRKFRTGDVFRVLPGTEGRCVEYVCRVDDLLSLSTGEKMNPISFEQQLRLLAVSTLSSSGGAVLQLVRNVCLIGRGLPIAFAVIEPDYAAVEEAFAAASSAADPHANIAHWLEGELWRAVAKVNEGWSSACRVHRAAVIVLGPNDDPLPISRKKLVYRVLAEKRFENEMKARAARILSHAPVAVSASDQAKPAAAHRRAGKKTDLLKRDVLLALRECLAQVLAIPTTALEAVASSPSSSSSSSGTGSGGVDGQPFASLGLTSLLIARLAAIVAERFEVAGVTTATLYTHITLDQLATHILSLRHEGGPTASDEPSPEPARLGTAATKEPLAITGMSCRFPGGADDLESYWALLKEGVDGITEVPRSRWDIDRLYDPDSDAPGKMHTRRGGFVEATERFDHRFFGISEHEAKMMDPRQRVALELVWEALETAGIPPRSLAGTRTGVFVALMDSSFQETLLAVGPPDLQYGTGGSATVVAGRISHVFELRGPSMTVDTACSSSLVAIDAAARAIRSGQCSKAIVVAVHAVLTPTSSVFLSKARMISPNGRCATFDADADGYCRSEGYGAVVLERQGDVEAGGRPAWGLLCGSAVNHNGGTSNGITAPSTLAQREVLTAALADAAIEPERVSLVEAHGTGTPVGDPIEMAALVEVYGKPRWRARQNAARSRGSELAPVAVASVKTNIGHCEPSSGMAGVIKVLLAMRHGVIPPHIQFKKLNPLIDLRPSEASLYIPTAAVPWKPDPLLAAGQDHFNATAQQLFAGVSSFGFAGANAHVILSSPPPPTQSIPTSQPLWAGPFVLPFSATNAESLLVLGRRLLSHCEAKSALDSESSRRAAAELCFTAALGRTHFLHGKRAAVVGRDLAELAAGLRSWLASAERELQSETRTGGDRLSSSTKSRSSDRPRVCFVLSGQGSQYVGMGRELHRSCLEFQRALQECEEAWREVVTALLPRRTDDDLPAVASSLVELIYPEGESDNADSSAALDRTANSQPALLAFEYALARQWQAWGVEPAILTGHSLGEIVAAVVAGMLTLREGLALVASRGWWMQRCPGTGAMAAVFATREQAEALIAKCSPAVPGASEGGGVLVLAAVNGPTSVVVSGDRRSVERLMTAAEAEDIKVRPLDNVHSAFHSPLLSDAVDRWTAEAESHIFATNTKPGIDDASSQEGTPVIISATTASPLTLGDARSMRHWRQHALEAVLLWPAVASLLREPHGPSAVVPSVLLEIGPSSILTSQIRRALPTLSAVLPPWGVKAVPSLVKGKDSCASAFEALGHLYVAGVDINWPAVYADLKRAIPDLRMTSIPTYAFLPTRCWLGPMGLSTIHGNDASASSSSHRSAWSPLDRPSKRYVEWTWDVNNDAELVPLRQHQFDGKAVLPAAAMLGLLLPSVSAVTGTKSSHPISIARLSILSRVQVPPPPAAASSNTSATLCLQLVCDKETDGGFDLYAVDNKHDATSATRCATGKLQLINGLAAAHAGGSLPSLADAKAMCQRSIDVALLYDDLQAAGLHYGPLFRGVRALWAAVDDSNVDGAGVPQALLSRIEVPEAESPAAASATPPAWVVDACLHTAGGFFIDANRTFLPIEFEGFHLLRPWTTKPGQSLWCLHQRVLSTSDDEASLSTVKVTVFDDDGQALLAIDKYVAKEVRSETMASRLIYDIEWEEVLPHPAEPLQPDEPPILLAFVDSHGACLSLLAEALRHRPNARHVTILPAADFSSSSSTPSAAPTSSLSIGLRPDTAEDYQAALAAAFLHFKASAQSTSVRVLFGWPLDASTNPSQTVRSKGEAPDLIAASRQASRPALLLLQALASRENVHPAQTEVVFLTRDAATTTWPRARGVDAGEKDRSLDLPRLVAACAQASLHGLATVAATEFPEIVFTVVDLERTSDPAATGECVQAVGRILDSSVLAKEDRLAVRDGRIYAPRLTRPPAPPTPAAQSSERNEDRRAAVVTGAFGGVGSEICKRLVGEGRHPSVFLVGRNVPEDPATWTSDLLSLPVADLSPVPGQATGYAPTPVQLPSGISLWFCRADVSQPADVDSLFGHIAGLAGGPPAQQTSLLDVHHCAGVLRDAMLTNLTWDALERVVEPKAVGALNLLRASVEHKIGLRSFVLCSSITNVVGTAGQANYAAANAVVECMAAQCQIAGFPVRAVCWGLWRDVGMASSAQPDRSKNGRPNVSPVNAGGVRVLPMEAADALDALDLIDAAPVGHSSTVAIADVAWGRQQSSPQPTRVSLWKRFTGDTSPSGDRAADEESRPARSIEERLHEMVCEVLAIGRDTAIADDALLAEVGFDSMSGMELRGALARDAGLWLPLKTFRSPTKASILAAYRKAVAERGQPIGPQPGGGPQPVAVQPAVRTRNVGTPQLASKWLDFIGGDAETATLRVVCFGDAGGDPANFKSWLSFIDTARIEVWAFHFPRHTTRSSEDPCPSLVYGAEAFMSEAFPFLAEKPYVLFGQCIGAYYALRFTEEMRNAIRRDSPAAAIGIALPVGLLASACPGPSDLEVLTTYTRRPTMYEGLKALSLAIGWTEEEWERFSSNTTLYQALVADVSMAGMECQVSEEDPIDVPITVLLGDLDPVVKRRHVASWMGVTSRSFALEWLPGQGHNMQFEPPLVQCVNRALLRLAPQAWVNN